MKISYVGMTMGMTSRKLAEGLVSYKIIFITLLSKQAVAMYASDQNAAIIDTQALLCLH